MFKKTADLVEVATPYHVSLLTGTMRYVKVFLQEITHQLLMPVHLFTLAAQEFELFLVQFNSYNRSFQLHYSAKLEYYYLLPSYVTLCGYYEQF